jgi:hypothetical protein
MARGELGQLPTPAIVEQSAELDPGRFQQA